MKISAQHIGITYHVKHRAIATAETLYNVHKSLSDELAAMNSKWNPMVMLFFEMYDFRIDWDDWNNIQIEKPKLGISFSTQN